MTNLDNRIANADQLLTTDIDKFCESVTDLYSNTCKPLLDVFIYIYRTTSTIGAQTPMIIMMYLLFSGVILTHLRRPTGNLTIQEQKLEGEYRYVNSRLITNSEEVAFYQGNVREKLTIFASFNKLTAHLRKFLEFRVGMGVVDNLVAKCKKAEFFNVFRQLLTILALQISQLASASMRCQFHSSTKTTNCCKTTKTANVWEWADSKIYLINSN